jgi:hypothetical protein
MKVKELIEKLNKLDADADIVFSCAIESGFGSRVAADASLRIEDESEFVVLHIEGEEADCE